MLFTLLLLAGAPEAPLIETSRTIMVQPAPVRERYLVEVAVREDGRLIASPAMQLVRGEPAQLSVDGARAYRIEITAEPSPAARYSADAADDVFVASRLILPGEAGDRPVGDGVVAIEPGAGAGVDFEVSGSGIARTGNEVPATCLSVSYRLSALSN